MNKKVLDFIKEMISYHGFSSNTISGFSCYIPDNHQFSKKEGLLLWVCIHKKKKIVTKIERLVSNSRKNRLIKFLNISEKEFNEQYLPNVINYSNILYHQFGFRNIGRGISLNINTKIYNRSVKLSSFENNLKLLRDFEVFLIKNPISRFAESNLNFRVKEKNNLLFDRYY